jgi:hypothetical protein
MTLQEKDMTAGISRVRVKNEIDRSSISSIGLAGGGGLGRDEPGDFCRSGGRKGAGEGEDVGHGISP